MKALLCLFFFIILIQYEAQCQKTIEIETTDKYVDSVDRLTDLEKISINKKPPIRFRTILVEKNTKRVLKVSTAYYNNSICNDYFKDNKLVFTNYLPDNMVYVDSSNQYLQKHGKIYYQNKSVIFSTYKPIKEKILKIIVSDFHGESGYYYECSITKDSISWMASNRIHKNIRAIKNSKAHWESLTDSISISDFDKVIGGGRFAESDGMDHCYTIKTDKTEHILYNPTDEIYYKYIENVLDRLDEIQKKMPR